MTCRTLIPVFLGLAGGVLGLRGQIPLPPTATGLLYLSGSTGQVIAECQPNGTVLRTLAPAGMVTPRGIAFDDDGNLMIVCEGSARILRVRLDGTVLQTIQHPDLTLGTGIARAANGNWYVGNFSPGRVLVFSATGTHLTTITRTGMTGVNCVSFDPSGDFAVTAASTAQVHRFSAAHVWLGVVTHSTLSSPMSIARDSAGNHYVSNGGNALVTKFDANWGFVSSFGTGVLSGPQGIAIDEFDMLTVSNFYSSTVARYSAQGLLLGGFVHAGLGTVRNLAWQVTPTLLARAGTVGAQGGAYQRPLVLNGGTGDLLGAISIAASAPFALDLLSYSGPPGRPPHILFLELGAPGAPVWQPLGLEWFSFPTALTGGSPLVLSDTLAGGAFGASLLPPLPNALPLLDLPAGLGLIGTFTLQGFVLDPQAKSAPSLPISPTNTLVLNVF